MVAIAKFAVGDRVLVRSDMGDAKISRGLYTVTRIMPASADGFSYRVKNENDVHERVISEVQLARS